ncbi:MAG: hypothetical protein JNL12_19100 [Planctomycetes bacterium]|jgi:hypothetical protein|nr:hypothetical protein [Planctomycetota bacterium]
MKRTAALLFCLAAAWILYSTVMEVFIAWYSGVEDQLDAGAWMKIVTFVVVSLAALVLFGHLALHPASQPKQE